MRYQNHNGYTAGALCGLQISTHVNSAGTNSMAIQQHPQLVCDPPKDEKILPFEGALSLSKWCPPLLLLHWKHSLLIKEYGKSLKWWEPFTFGRDIIDLPTSEKTCMDQLNTSIYECVLHFQLVRVGQLFGPSQRTKLGDRPVPTLWWGRTQTKQITKFHQKGVRHWNLSFVGAGC